MLVSTHHDVNRRFDYSRYSDIISITISSTMTISAIRFANNFTRYLHRYNWRLLAGATRTDRWRSDREYEFRFENRLLTFETKLFVRAEWFVFEYSFTNNLSHDTIRNFLLGHYKCRKNILKTCVYERTCV